MPNYCDYELRLRGQKKSVLKLAEWLEANYCYSEEPKVYLERDGMKIPTEHHIGWRIFDCYYNAVPFKILADDTDITLYANGYCAWSVYSCFMEGPFTYYTDNHDEMMERNGKDYSLTLPMACRELMVEAEIFSNEPGMCFAEHYQISKDGEVLKEEETEYLDIYIEEFESYDKFKAEYENDCPVTEKEFNDAKSKGDSCIQKCSWLYDNLWPFELV